jgi:hypothetical protein
MLWVDHPDLSWLLQQMDEPVEMASSSLLSKMTRPAEGNLIDLVSMA